MKSAFEYRLMDLLPLAVQKTDASFLECFVSLKATPTYSHKIIAKSIILACERNDNNETLLYLYGKFLGQFRFSLPAEVMKAIGETKLDFNTAHGLSDILYYRYDTSGNEFPKRVKLLLNSFKANNHKIFVPEGELLNMDCIEQHKAFNRKFSNFYVEPKTDSTSSLIYRERNGTKHQIEIGRRLDQSGDSISHVYSYENMETKNMNELLVRTSLATRIFSSFPHQYIAVTKELLELPYEQQPWFRGIITEKGRRAVGTDAPSSSTFFTYSSGNRVVLAFTETDAVTDFKCYPLKHQILQGENISTHFTPNRFPLGVYNGGHVTGSNEHFIRRAVSEGDLEKVKRLLVAYNVDLKTNKYLTEPDNMLQEYISMTTNQSVNNDMVCWLLENGINLGTGGQPAALIGKAVKICDERVIQLLAKREIFDSFAIRSVTERGVSISTLKVVCRDFGAINYYRDYGKVIETFLSQVKAKKYREVVHNRKAFVMTAWKYDHHCLFRQLPQELMLEILSYDGIDEPPYWELLEFAVESQNDGTGGTLGLHSLPAEHLIRVIPLVWKHWDNPKYNDAQKETLLTMYAHPSYPGRTEHLDTVMKWMMKFLQRLPVEDIPAIPSTSNQMKLHCLRTPTELASTLLKLLLVKGVLSTEKLQTPTLQFEPGTNRWQTIPPMFWAVYAENKLALEVLVEKGVFTDAMMTYFKDVPHKQHLKEFVLKLIQEKQLTTPRKVL
jgi:hypothetical protein